MLLCYILRKQLQNNIANWPKIYFLAPFQESNIGGFRDAQAPLLHVLHVFITNLGKFVIGALGGIFDGPQFHIISVKSQSNNPEFAVEHTECGDAKTFTFSVI
jgi:hypothetical protein